VRVSTCFLKHVPKRAEWDCAHPSSGACEPTGWAWKFLFWKLSGYESNSTVLGLQMLGVLLFLSGSAPQPGLRPPEAHRKWTQPVSRATPAFWPEKLAGETRAFSLVSPCVGAILQGQLQWDRPTAMKSGPSPGTQGHTGLETVAAVGTGVSGRDRT
jgi:hypothetical protein